MIALVDCNNFYASCERVFNPKLVGRPIVVLSNNDGCIIARSDEAKVLGIKMGAPAFLIKDMLEKNMVTVFSSNYTLYGSLSDRVMQTLFTFSQDVEVYSIDESFLSFDNMRFQDIEGYAKGIKEKVYQNVGIPVSVGVARTKTLSKMANRFAKKNNKQLGVHILDSDHKIQEVLHHTLAADVWGVGPQYAKLLERNGIKTALELSRLPEEWVRTNMSVVGQRLWQELHGIPCIQLELETPKKKNICIARSFGQLLSSLEDIAEALANYTAVAARKLRDQDSCTQIVHVFLQTNNFRSQDKQYYRSINIQLPVATNHTPELLHYAHFALQRIWKPGYNFKKVGVMLLELIPANQIQQGFFDTVDRSRQKKLIQTLDGINSSFQGKEMVKFARQGSSKKWKLRQEMLSPCYTTRIHDILTVKSC